MAEQEEIWKEIPGTFGSYAASNLGRIKRLVRTTNSYAGKILKQMRYTGGYLRVTLSFMDNAGIRRCFQAAVHSTILRTFVSERPPKHQANHKNGVKTDNVLSNLEWVTPAENSQHAVKMGLSRSGERLHNAKLSREKAAEIRLLYSQDKVPILRLAHRYGVSHATIRSLVRGKTWKTLACVLVLVICFQVPGIAQEANLTTSEIREGAVRVEQLILSWDREKLLRDTMKSQGELTARERDLASRELTASQKETQLALKQADEERRRAEEFKLLYERASKKRGGFGCFLRRIIFKPCRA
jgi:NUMOD4 motif.